MGNLALRVRGSSIRVPLQGFYRVLGSRVHVLVQPILRPESIFFRNRF